MTNPNETLLHSSHYFRHDDDDDGDDDGDDNDENDNDNYLGCDDVTLMTPSYIPHIISVMRMMMMMMMMMLVWIMAMMLLELELTITTSAALNMDLHHKAKNVTRPSRNVFIIIQTIVIISSADSVPLSSPLPSSHL